MHKELFDDAIGEVPPSTVDVDAVIVRGRRAARVRRVMNPAVAAGVAVVLLTGAVAYTLTREDGVGGTGVQPTTGPSSGVAPPKPEACKRTDLETPAQLDARLTQVARQAVTTQRSDVRLAVYPTAQPGTGPLEFYQTPENTPICDGTTTAEAMAVIHGLEGPGNLMIELKLSHAGAPSTMKCDASIGQTDSCEVVTGANGDVIRKTTTRIGDGMAVNHVEVVRPDGTTVIVTADNFPPTGAPTGSAPPLSLDQLVAIGTGPGMTLFP